MQVTSPIFSWEFFSEESALSYQSWLVRWEPIPPKMENVTREFHWRESSMMVKALCWYTEFPSYLDGAGQTGSNIEDLDCKWWNHIHRASHGAIGKIKDGRWGCGGGGSFIILNEEMDKSEYDNSGFTIRGSIWSTHVRPCSHCVAHVYHMVNTVWEQKHAQKVMGRRWCWTSFLRVWINKVR